MAPSSLMPITSTRCPGPLRSTSTTWSTAQTQPGDVAEIAMLKENNAALWARVRELESQVPPY
jgi:hypothetical protein